MKDISIKYNPYKLQTVFTVDGKPLKRNSRLDTSGRLLQEWVKDLPNILYEEYSTKDFNINFSGTINDFADLSKIAKDAEKNGIRINLEHVSVISTDSVKDELYAIAKELSDLPEKELVSDDITSEVDSYINKIYYIYIIKSNFSNADNHDMFSDILNDSIDRKVHYLIKFADYTSPDIREAMEKFEATDEIPSFFIFQISAKDFQSNSTYIKKIAKGFRDKSVLYEDRMRFIAIDNTNGLRELLSEIDIKGDEQLVFSSKVKDAIHDINKVVENFEDKYVETFRVKGALNYLQMRLESLNGNAEPLYEVKIKNSEKIQKINTLMKKTQFLDFEYEVKEQDDDYKKISEEVEQKCKETINKVQGLPFLEEYKKVDELITELTAEINSLKEPILHKYAEKVNSSIDDIVINLGVYRNSLKELGVPLSQITIPSCEILADTSFVLGYEDKMRRFVYNDTNKGNYLNELAKVRIKQEIEDNIETAARSLIRDINKEVTRIQREFCIILSSVKELFEISSEETMQHIITINEETEAIINEINVREHISEIKKRLENIGFDKEEQ